jgi:hypothetical protein
MPRGSKAVERALVSAALGHCCSCLVSSLGKSISCGLSSGSWVEVICLRKRGSQAKWADLAQNGPSQCYHAPVMMTIQIGSDLKPEQKCCLVTIPAPCGWNGDPVKEYISPRLVSYRILKRQNPFCNGSRIACFVNLTMELAKVGARPLQVGLAYSRNGTSILVVLSYSGNSSGYLSARCRSNWGAL